MKRALVLIDLQVALLHGAWREAEVLARLAEVVARARRQGLPVIHVQHNHATFEPMMKGAPGWQIHPTVAPRSGEPVIEKQASDAFHGTDLRQRLLALGVEQIVIAGLMTEYCVDATARAALSQGFDVLLLGDCHTTGDSTLAAADIVAHHNAVLPNLVHPEHRIVCVDAAELDFTR